jgi:phage terminase small subunit
MSYAPPDPPRHLSTESRELWRTLTAAYEFDPHELKTLRLALEALDRCNMARRAIRRHGMTFVDRLDNVRVRPEIAIERDAKAQWVKLMAALDLPAEEGPQTYGRPVRNARTGRYNKRAS